MKLCQTCICTSRVCIYTLGFKMLRVKIIYDIGCFFLFIVNGRILSHWSNLIGCVRGRYPRHSRNLIGRVSGQFFYDIWPRSRNPKLPGRKIYHLYDLFSKVDRFSKLFRLTLENIDSNKSYCDANELYYSNASNNCKKTQRICRRHTLKTVTK